VQLKREDFYMHLKTDALSVLVDQKEPN